MGFLKNFGCKVAKIMPAHQPGFSKTVFTLLEPPQGFEPWAYALRVRCSTPELRWLAAKATLTF